MTAKKGLQQFTEDEALTQALQVTTEEWNTLASIQSHKPISKDGYVQLLLTLRAVT